MENLWACQRPLLSPDEEFSADLPQQQERVLEDNLRRLRDIHEGIHRLRQVNAQQISLHNINSSLPRLSNSCPSLILTSSTDGNEIDQNGLKTMSAIRQRISSFSCTSYSFSNELARSADSVEVCNVKIHVNDTTPSSSQEHLSTTNIKSISSCNAQKWNHSNKSSHNSGTTTEKCAKKLSKKIPVRTHSLSSLGMESRTGFSRGKSEAQRRWSLSSMGSDSDEIFYDTGYLKELNSEAIDFLRTKKGHSGDMPKQFHFLQQSMQNSNVQSLSDISLQVSENGEPDKTSSMSNLLCNAKSNSWLHSSAKLNTLQKSVSTPSIPIAKETLFSLIGPQDFNEEESIQICPSLHMLNAKANTTVSSPVKEEDDGNYSKDVMYKYHLSLAGLVRERSALSGNNESHISSSGDDDRPFIKRKKQSSFFFKRKRSKEKEKEGKKSPHQFSPISLAAGAVCDVCHKSFNKKATSLQCLNCCVIVHDNSCKEQLLDCNKLIIPKISSLSSNISMHDKLTGGIQTRSHSYIDFEDKRRNRQSHSTRRQTLLAGLDSCVFDGDLHKPLTDQSTLRRISNSLESLDEGSQEISDFEDDQELGLTENETEAWNSSVDKRILKKLKDKDLKRQEAIYELIITEKHHCLTLKIMQKVFAQGMKNQLHMSKEQIDKIFPSLNELLEFHIHFLRRLRERQRENQIVTKIGDILVEEFQGSRAELMVEAYGNFCSSHSDSLSCYKDVLKSDRKFEHFIKKCKAKKFCKAREIPECILLVTQRITKYPLLISALMKATKDNKQDYDDLSRALNGIKDIIFQVNCKVDEREKKHQLVDIYNKIDSKSTAFFRGKKFKKLDLLSNNRKLRYKCTVTWINSRRKSVDVTATILSDYIFFFQENNQKYHFASLDNKAGVVSLQKLILRSKAGDARGIYLISPNKNEPEMYELLCFTTKDQEALMKEIRDAVVKCPDNDDGKPYETEEERKLEEACSAKLKLICMLHEKDLQLANVFRDKMRIMTDMLELCGIESEIFDNFLYTQLMDNDNGSEMVSLAESALENASRIVNTLYTSGTNLCRSVSSVGEHQSETFVSPLLPKRALTFGGFDNFSKEPIPLNKILLTKKKIFPPECIKDSSLEDKTSSLKQFDFKTSDSSKEYRQSNDASPPESIVPIDKNIGIVQKIGSVITSLLISQGKDQLINIVELAHHLSTLGCIVAHMSSTIESLKVKLADPNDKRIKFLKEQKDSREKRSIYCPEDQLEELRNRQEQLSQERAEWHQQQIVQESELEQKAEELQRLQEQIKLDQEDINKQREQLYRKLEALQKEGIILSPSYTVVNRTGTQLKDPESSNDSKMFVDNTSEQIHKKSLEFYTNDSTNVGLSSSFNSEIRIRPESKLRSTQSASNLPTSRKPDSVPLHLCSATNMQKRPSVSNLPVKQQLPLKLASRNSMPNGAITQSHSFHDMPQQVLPLKLATGILTSSIPSVSGHGSLQNSKSKRSYSAASSPSSTLINPVHVRGGSSPATVQTTGGSSVATSSQEIKIVDYFDSPKIEVNEFSNSESQKERDASEEIFC